MTNAASASDAVNYEQALFHWWQAEQRVLQHDHEPPEGEPPKGLHTRESAGEVARGGRLGLIELENGAASSTASSADPRQDPQTPSPRREGYRNPARRRRSSLQGRSASASCGIGSAR